jgi:beta-phosphoglucomutase family hydrolase
MLGLPDTITTCLFDLDGVLTDTASVHRAAWKQTFDAVLAERDQPQFTEQDYNDYVDGKPRADGVRDFLASRGIRLPEGAADDPPAAPTVYGVGNRKNELLLAKIHTDGVRVYEGSRRYLQRAQAAELHRAVVSSSANTADVLRVTGLAGYVEGRVDGNTLRQQGLRGKPAPDSFLAGARLFGEPPAGCAVFEDALAGVQAGRDGGFGCVVGVNRLDDEHGRQLHAHGASVVVRDLAELLGADAAAGANDGGAR